MPSILVSGPVRGDFASLFKAVAKAQKKGEFAAALCVGNFLGETREAPADAAPLPVYVVTGEDAIDADLASRLAARISGGWVGAAARTSPGCASGFSGVPTTRPHTTRPRRTTGATRRTTRATT